MFWYVSLPSNKKYHIKACSLPPGRFIVDTNLKLTPGIQRGSMPKEVATIYLYLRFLKLACCSYLLLPTQCSDCTAISFQQDTHWFAHLCWCRPRWQCRHCYGPFSWERVENTQKNIKEERGSAYKKQKGCKLFRAAGEGQSRWPCMLVRDCTLGRTSVLDSIGRTRHFSAFWH